MSSIITDLPRELLDLIFSNLTKPHDRRRVAEVCKLFYAIIRFQSTGNSTLDLTRYDNSKSFIRVFENSNMFPFSKLRLCEDCFVGNSSFWTLHGPKICEIFIGELDMLESLPTWSSYFPNLKKLTIEVEFRDGCDYIDNKTISRIISSVSLPIEELITWDLPLEENLMVLRCSPLLKKLKIGPIESYQLLPQLSSWFESIESCRVGFSLVPLEKLINLPSNVTFTRLLIQTEDKSEIIREFFKRPRVIEKLILERRNYNRRFNKHEEEGDNNPRYIYFSRDQAEALNGAKSIKKVKLRRGVLEFDGSLDLLAKLPGLESISLILNDSRPDQLRPFYWSSPETTKKICKIQYAIHAPLHYLNNLSNVTWLSVILRIHDDEFQSLIQNSPNLETLYVEGMDRVAINAKDSIRSENRMPLLTLCTAPNMETVTSSFKFPHLKNLSLNLYKLIDENDAKIISQNCQNVEEIYLADVSINDEGLEHLLRHLPYLQSISIDGNAKYSMSSERILEMRKEFPYIKIDYRIE